MFYSIDAPIRGSNDFIENHEGSLERSKLNKCLQGFGINLSGLCNLLTPSSQAGEVEICVGFLFVRSNAACFIEYAPLAPTRSTSNVGSTTPDTFSCEALTRKDAVFACSCTRYEMSPVAYVTSAIENEANCITRPIFLLACGHNCT